MFLQHARCLTKMCARLTKDYASSPQTRHIGVVKNGTSRILGLVNFSSDLEISTAFAKSLEVSFIVHLLRSRSLACLVSVSDIQTAVSASRRVLDHSPPLHMVAGRLFVRKACKLIISV